MAVSIRDKTDLSHGGICRRDCNLPHKIVHALLDLNDIALKGVDTIFRRSSSSRSTRVAHLRNRVPWRDFTRYPTEITTSRS